MTCCRITDQSRDCVAVSKNLPPDNVDRIRIHTRVVDEFATLETQLKPVLWVHQCLSYHKIIRLIIIHVAAYDTNKGHMGEL